MTDGRQFIGNPKFPIEPITPNDSEVGGLNEQEEEVQPESEPKPEPKLEEPEPTPEKKELPYTGTQEPEVPTEEPILDTAKGDSREDIKKFLISRRPDIFAPESFEGQLSNLSNPGEDLQKLIDQASLGVGDTIFGQAHWLPWLKPAKKWWDKYNPRSDDVADEFVRKAGGIIIPNVVLGGWAVQGAKGLTASANLPAFTRIGGEIALRLGIDTAVVATSTSRDDPNLAGMLNNAFGSRLIPWGTQPSDSPDARLAGNLYENLAIAGLGELAQYSLLALGGKSSTKMIPKNFIAEEQITKRAVKRKEIAELIENTDDDLTDAFNTRKNLQKSAENAEAVTRYDAGKGDKDYDPFVNQPFEPQKRAVGNQEVPDPLLAALDEALIQNNIGTQYGRARPAISTKGMRNIFNAAKGTVRGSILDDIGKNLPSQINFIHNGKKISSEVVEAAVDKLTENITKMNPQQFAKELDLWKRDVYSSQKILTKEGFEIYSAAFKRAFDTMLSPDNLRASSVITQQAANQAVDAARATRAVGAGLDTSRQQELIWENLGTVIKETRANRFIWGHQGQVLQLKNLAKTNPELAAQKLVQLSNSFDTELIKAKEEASELVQNYIKISNEDPEFLKPFAMAVDATNGKVSDLDGLNLWMKNSLGIWNKAFYDANPEMPSLVLQGLNSYRYNNILSGKAAFNAAGGNGVMLVAKPISAFAGSWATQDGETFKRALYTYGGIFENLQRAFKVLGDDWRLAVRDPDLARVRGRADLSRNAMQNIEILEEMEAGLMKENRLGQVALIRIAKLFSGYNKHPIPRWGVNAMYAIDGFTNSMMASGIARAEAYDTLMTGQNGAVIDLPFTGTFRQKFDKMQKELYNKSFDDSGLLTNEAARTASREIALNLDSNIADGLETVMNRVPVLRSQLMFPRTGLNGLELFTSFVPQSKLGPTITRARRFFQAESPLEIKLAMQEHGFNNHTKAQYDGLKAEYIGRQLMGGSVVLATGLLALNNLATGNLTESPSENKRLLNMGIKPMTLINPFDRSQSIDISNFPVFNKLIGLSSDFVFHSDRIDSLTMEKFWRKLSMAIGMNITNDTFMSNFEALVKLHDDPSAWSRFTALYTDSLIPATGMRQIFNNALVPQLKDVENEWRAWLANRNKFLGPIGDGLKDEIDIYTGEPIRYTDKLTSAVNSINPFFKFNGGLEPWRQWLLSTGWDGLPDIRTNKETGELLSADDRQIIKTFIAENVDLAAQIQTLMTEPDSFYINKLKEYKQEVKFKKFTQQEYPLKQFVVHKVLDNMHRQAYNLAWAHLVKLKPQLAQIGALRDRRDRQLKKGAIKQPSRDAEEIRKIKELLKFSGTK